MTTRKLDTDKQVFFYEQEFYVLSNFSSFTLKWKSIRFDTSEAAYHWEKFINTYEPSATRWELAINHSYNHIQRAIQHAPSAHAAFYIAQQYKPFQRPDWDKVKVKIMKDILRAKVGQHDYVRKKLLETGDRELIEDSWRDNFWGWGENKDGQNMLGKLWMEVREELRSGD